MITRPTRRATLTVIGAALAGCVGDATESVEDTSDQPPPPPEYPDHEFDFGVSGFDVTAETEHSVPAEAPVSFTLTVNGDSIEDENDISITYELTNHHDEAIRVFSRTAPPNPFGRVTLEEEVTLHAWTPLYEENAWVQTEPHLGIVGWNDYAESTELAAGQTIQETYLLSDKTHRLQPGSFSYDNSIEITDSYGTSWEIVVSAQFEIVSREQSDGDVMHHLDATVTEEPANEFPGEYTVEVLAPVTDAHPGLVEITLTNDGDESIDATRDHGPISTYVGEASDGTQLVLLSETMYAPGLVNRDEEWWQATMIPPEEGDQGEHIYPNERYSKRYVVAGAPAENAPSSGKEFVFEQEIAAFDDDFSWNFTLSTLSPGS